VPACRIRRTLPSRRFEIGLRTADLRETLFASGHLRVEVVVAALRAEPFVLGGIGRLGVGQEVVDLGLKIGFALGHPLVAHGLAPTGVGSDLRAVQADPAQLDHPRLLAQLQDLQEQRIQRGQMPAPEPGHRPEVRCLVRGQEPKRHIVMAGLLDLARRPHPGRVPVDQHLQHQPRVVGRIPALLGVDREERLEVHDLLDQLGHEPCQMVLWHPVRDRWRHQEHLIQVIGPKRLVHRAPHRRLDRLGHRHLEQAVLTSRARHPTSIFDPAHDRESTGPSMAITDPRS